MIRYREIGQGAPVVALDAHGALVGSPFWDLLAQKFRMIAFDALPRDVSLGNEPTSLRTRADTLARMCEAVGLQRCALIASPEAAGLALCMAAQAAERVEAIVLISPPSPLSEGSDSRKLAGDDAELEGVLSGINAATLVLHGTEDRVRPGDVGRIYARQMPRCFYTLVYDAGSELARERPEALAALVTDFLERRESFIVNRSSTALNQ